MPSSRDRIPALDALRGIAILAVILSHAVWPLGGPVWLQIGREVWRFGWCGVDLFFVLSGYLITGVLLSARERPGYFTRFYSRRALRILPPFAAVLGFVILVAPHLGVGAARMAEPAARDQWVYWLFLGNVPAFRTPNLARTLGPLWSLAVEEQFYLVWPWVVLLVQRERLARVCVVLIVGAFLVRCALVIGAPDPHWAYELMPARMDALAAGALVRVADVDARRGWAPWLIWLGALGAVLSFCVHLSSNAGALTQTLGYSAFAALGAGLVICASENQFSAPAWLRRLGTYSYTMYLIHLPVIVWLRESGLRQEDIGNVPFLLIVLVIVIPVAALSWQCWESRLLVRRS